jgi:hypothetical protein
VYAGALTMNKILRLGEISPGVYFLNTHYVNGFDSNGYSFYSSPFDLGTGIPTYSAGNNYAVMYQSKYSKSYPSPVILNSNDVDPSDEKFLLIGSGELADLLNTTEIKNADYNSVKALVQGQIDTFLGCKVIRTERLANDGSNTRYCMLYTKSGMGLAVGRDVQSRVTEESTLHFAKQLYFSMSMGASRLEEKKVVEIAVAY